jgi:hypothetical protein
VKPAAVYKDTKAALWKGPHGEEMRPPYIHHQLSSHMSHLRSSSVAPVKLQMTAFMADSLTTTPGETLSQNYPAKLFLNSFPTETEIINVC